MFSRSFKKYFGLRVKLMIYGGGTIYAWDKKEDRLAPASVYQLLAIYNGQAGGYLFVLIHVIQIYLKLTEDQIVEEHDPSIPEEEDYRQKMAFAILIIEFGEAMLCLCVTFLIFVVLRRTDSYMFLTNELFNYNSFLSELISKGKLKLTPELKRTVRLSEFLGHLVMWISVVLPFLILITVTSSLEPTNILMREWLEIKFEFRVKYIPLIILMNCALYGVGSVVCQLMMIVDLYWITSTVCFAAFTPKEMMKMKGNPGNRCLLKTQCFGELDDSEVMHLYRTQQILNVLMTECFASLLISFHHVGLMATEVVLICFAIRFNDVLAGEGILAYVIVASVVLAPMLMLYYQSKNGGEIADMSDAFKNAGHALVPRRMMFRKFARSCWTFYIQVAHPFYNVDKATFLSFCEQCLDHTITLLLW